MTEQRGALLFPGSKCLKKWVLPTLFPITECFVCVFSVLRVYKRLGTKCSDANMYVRKGSNERECVEAATGGSDVLKIARDRSRQGSNIISTC